MLTDMDDVGCPEAKIDLKDGGSNCGKVAPPSFSVDVLIRGVDAWERAKDVDGDERGLRDTLGLDVDEASVFCVSAGSDDQNELLIDRSLVAMLSPSRRLGRPLVPSSPER